MQFSDQIINAVGLSIKFCVPFVLFVRPNSDTPVFFSNPGKSDSTVDSFIVKPWGGSLGAYEIKHQYNAEETIEFINSFDRPLSACPRPWPEPTTLAQYISSVDDLIDKLRDYGGKTVISKAITGNAKVDWIKVAQEYFDCHDEAFRYLYFTPVHGFWLGASPELLLKVSDNFFMTMALAGTRQVDEASQPWSGKNIAEQAVVRNYIVDRLYDLGLEPLAGETETVTTGNLQHLRTIISGQTSGEDPTEILAALNPTPALAGYPIAAAIENIIETERHPRRCYGGYVAVCSGKSTEAFVNLRCVNFDADSWCMYVGGGIMPDSDSNDEWLETEAKALILRNLIAENTI